MPKETINGMEQLSTEWNFSVIYLTQVLYDDCIKKFRNLIYEEKVIHSVYTQMNQIDIFQMKRYMVNT